MSVHNQEIAERLRAIRELSELTPEELAERMGMDAAEYKKCEAAQVEIPISVLYDVSNTLGVSITELLTGEQAKLHTFSVVRAGKGVSVERSQAYKYADLAYNFIDRKVSPFLVTIAPSEDDEPYHLNVHSGQEYHYCLEGSFKIHLAGKEITIREGDSLYFDSGNPHGMKAVGGKPARVLVVVI
ncbi:MAG: cupin domain-containing protein [Clostridiales bacterium]|jgi:mannose-6-phosphate isomerase-like protein (cupin superfamily)|nr:cupin domain-containing protein [Clostridiales bacterium]